MFCFFFFGRVKCSFDLALAFSASRIVLLSINFYIDLGSCEWMSEWVCARIYDYARHAFVTIRRRRSAMEVAKRGKTKDGAEWSEVKCILKLVYYAIKRYRLKWTRFEAFAWTWNRMSMHTHTHARAYTSDLQDNNLLSRLRCINI